MTGRSESWVGEYLQMVGDCEKRESRLTEWEQSFIQSIREWLEQEKPLTARQTDTLDRIWEKATEGG